MVQLTARCVRLGLDLAISLHFAVTLFSQWHPLCYLFIYLVYFSFWEPLKKPTNLKILKIFNTKQLLLLCDLLNISDLYCSGTHGQKNWFNLLKKASKVNEISKLK